jgi:hypothetical protein
VDTNKITTSRYCILFFAFYIFVECMRPIIVYKLNG